MLRKISLALIFVLVAGQPVIAGQVFPPENAEECDDTSVLAWKGSTTNVYCREATGTIGPAPAAVTAGSDYEAGSDGFLFVRVTADTTYRNPVATVKLDGTVLAEVMAQDNYVTGTYSVSDNQLTYPIRKGQIINVTMRSPAAATTIQFIPLH